MTPAERAGRAARYAALMEDGELGEAFDKIERDFSEAWKTTFDATERDNLWRAVQVVKKVREHFTIAISDGRVANHRIAEIKRVATR